MKGKDVSEVIHSVNDAMTDVSLAQGYEMMQVLSDVVLWAYDSELESDME
jgi:hypothetical protein